VKNDPKNKEFYLKNLKEVINMLDEHLFGKELVEILGGDVLAKLAEKGELIEFLNNNEYEGKKLIEYLGGWMKKMLPLRGLKLVTYHKNWVYFFRLFGLVEAGTIEPKPGIPPSPRHIHKLIKMMRKSNVKLILAANYFDKNKVRKVAKKVGAGYIIVPLYVNGVRGVNTYFKLVDYWIDSIIKAAKKEKII